MRSHKSIFQSAYTVVELIVVIVIIATLATVTALGYNMWKDDIARTEISSDLASVESAMRDARNWKDGGESGYPVFEYMTEFDGTNDTKKIFTQSPGVILTYMSGDSKNFCVEAVSKDRGNVYLFLDSTTGEMKKGTCAGGEGATPIPTSADYTLFTYNTAAPGCSGTIQLPIALPTNAPNSEIHWGDGSTQVRTSARPSHTYTKAGRYTVAYKGAMSSIDSYSIPTSSKSCITGVKQWADSTSLTQISNLGGANLTYVAEPPSTVTSMYYMFDGATAFNQPIGGWNTSKVTNMYGAFRGAKAFNQPIGGWNTSKVTNMGAMFSQASAFNQPIGEWDTSSVTNMDGMLQYTAFNQSINSWDTSKVENMNRLFAGTTSFNQPLANWDTSSVKSMTDMFYGASAFNQPIGGWNTESVTNMAGMFNRASAFNQPIGGWDMSKVTDTNSMFSNASSFNQPIGGWNTESVTNMYLMFYKANSFNQPIGGWNTFSVTNMSNTLNGAASFNQPISAWNVNAVTNWTNFRTGSPLTNANTPPKFL